MTTRYAAAYAHPSGPGDERPTAEQIVRDEGLIGKWADKVILITGCSSGIGVETAKALSKTGAKLYLTARNLEKAKKAIGELAVSPNVHLLQLDQESLESVRSCTSAFLAQNSRLHILVANAGVMMTRKETTKDGFELQFGVNHLSHFLLINLLMPALLSASKPSFQSRVVVLSSTGHKFSSVNFEDINSDGKFEAMQAYGQSKTANLWTANEIERRFGSQGLHAFSVHPGAVTTNLGQHMSEEEIQAITQDPKFMASYMNPAQGAATSVWAAVSKDLKVKGPDTWKTARFQLLMIPQGESGHQAMAHMHLMLLVPRSCGISPCNMFHLSEECFFRALHFARKKKLLGCRQTSQLRSAS